MPRTIKDLFAACDADRQGILETVRECARLTDHSLLPPKDHDSNQPLPGNYQSDGSQGLTALSGKVMLQAFPPGKPWVKQDLDAKVMFDPNVSDEQKIALQEALFVEDMILTSLIEKAGGTGGNDNVTGFYANVNSFFRQAIGTGDALCRVDDDFQLTVFRRDQYVTVRDTAKRVLCHIVKERQDPFGLPDKEQTRLWSEHADIKAKKTEDYTRDRQVDVYTLVEWDAANKRWATKREVDLNGKTVVVGEYTDEVTPYISCYWSLDAGEHYGRGLIEQNMGSLKSLDMLSMYILDFCDLASKAHFVVDSASDFDEKNLERPSGAIYRGRVRDGVVTDVAILRTDKSNEFMIAKDGLEITRANFGRASLSSTGAVRNSERTTAFEIDNTSLQELQNATSGFFASLADQFQMPLYRRVKWMARSKGLINTDYDQKGIKPVILTGLQDIASKVRFQSMLTLKDLAQGLGDTALARINMDTLLESAARFLGVWEPGLIKSREQMQAEIEQAMQLAARQHATETAITTAGKVAENKATQ